MHKHMYRSRLTNTSKLKIMPTNTHLKAPKQLNPTLLQKHTHVSVLCKQCLSVSLWNQDITPLCKQMKSNFNRQVNRFVWTWKSSLLQMCRVYIEFWHKQSKLLHFRKQLKHISKKRLNMNLIYFVNILNKHFLYNPGKILIWKPSASHLSC